LTGDHGVGRIGAHPPSELVASGRELGAVRPYGVAVEVNLSAWRRPGRGVSAQRITLELNDHTRRVDVGGLAEGIRVGARSSCRGFAGAERSHAQANRREYEDGINVHCCSFLFSDPDTARRPAWLSRFVIRLRLH